VSEVKEMATGKVAYSIEEFCQAFGVGRTKVYEEIEARRLLVRKSGRRTLIRVVDAHAWLDSLPGGA